MAQPGCREVCLLFACGVLFAAPVVAQPPPRPPFTLSDALARARAAMPEEAAAQARVEAARLGLESAGRIPNPVAELRFENWASGVPGGLPLDIFATVTHTFEFGGKRSARRGIAEAALESVQATATVTRRAVELEVARTYLEAVRARDRQQTLAIRADELAEIVRILQSRVSVGAAAEADLMKMRTEWARAQADVTRARLAASRALAFLTARLDVDATLDSLVLPTPPARSEADSRADGQQRADVVAAGRVVEAARRALQLENSRAMPDAFLNGGLKRTAGYNTGVVALNVAIPLFDRNRTARALAQGQVRAAEYERNAIERRALAEIAATREASTRLAEQAAAARSTLVAPARGALDAARSAFQSGAFDVLRLLDAERVYGDAALLAIDLDVDAVASAVEARIAAGEDPLP